MTAPPPRTRRPAGTAAGLLAVAAAGPLAGGTVLLLADALGGVVRVPGDVVLYMAFTALVLGCAALVPVLWAVRRLPPRRVTAAGGALAGLAVALAGAVPAAPVFATGLLAAGVLAGPLLALPRAHAARSPGGPARVQAAALAGTAAAAWIATSWSDSPGTALLIAGAAAAVLAALAAAVPDGGPASPSVRRAARVRDALAARDVRAALPAYAAAGWIVGASLMGGLHLLTFRWNLVGGEPVRYLAWALLAAPLPVVVARRAAGTPRIVPWALLAGAAAPVLMATAPDPALLAAGFAIATAAAGLAAAALDAAVLRPPPGPRHPAAAGLTAVAAVAGGLAGFSCSVVLRGSLAEGSALTLTAVPPVLGALLALRVRGPAAPPSRPFLDVRDLSVRAGPVPLRGIRLRMEAGEVIALSGPGASALLAALAGLLPARGRMLLGGADLTALDAGQRTSLGLCHLAGPRPRSPRGLPIAEGLAGHARTLGHADPGAAARSVLDVFPALRGLGDRPAEALTDAQRGLLSLAEALLTRPRLLLVDGVAGGPCGDAAHAVLRRLAAAGTAVVVAGPAAPETLALARRACAVERDRVAELPAPVPGEVPRPPSAARSNGGTEQ
ncbi:hypothetical protein GCM10010182_44830 [Actinomadura cremea]|nr:hypothetical protein GCM10010182_44830 [Actinomadura cremea]